MTRIPTAIVLSLASTGLLLLGPHMIQGADDALGALAGLMVSLTGAALLVVMVLVITGRRM